MAVIGPLRAALHTTWPDSPKGGVHLTSLRPFNMSLPKSSMTVVRECSRAFHPDALLDRHVVDLPCVAAWVGKHYMVPYLNSALSL